MNQYYQEDLAYIHDIGFGNFARESGPGLLAFLGEKGEKNGLVVDLGCGSGILAKALTQEGYHVLGIDLSPAMLELARKKAPIANFKQASLFRVEIPPCQAVTCIGECLNYQFDQDGEAQLQELFKRIYQALSQGGVFIFDILEPDSITNQNSEKTYYEGEDWAILLEKEADQDRNILTRKITIFRQVNNFYRRSQEIHSVKLYPISLLAKQLEKIGFSVKIIAGYGTLKFRKGLRGCIATKI